MRHAVKEPDSTETLYSCPVCGIDLIKADFDMPERQYWCPFCSTRHLPRVAYERR